MLEYNLDDAEALLKKNQEVATKSLKQVEDELSYITEQTTTLEVSILLNHTRTCKYQDFVPLLYYIM